MFDTNVTIVGNVLTAPEWRRTSNTNSLVANFKVASTARRLDRDSGRWIDGNSLRVRVNCWRKLAEGVAASVMVGDPVVVVGRLYTRDWTDAEGNPRTLYEMEAVAVGHDLARGRGKFLRNRPTLATSAVEDAQADSQVRGEATEAVPDDEAPARPGDGLFDDGDADFADAPDPAVMPPSSDPGERGTEPSVDDLSPYDELSIGPSGEAFTGGELPSSEPQSPLDDLALDDPAGEPAAQPAGRFAAGAGPVRAHAEPVEPVRGGPGAARRGRRVGARMSVPA